MPLDLSAGHVLELCTHRPAAVTVRCGCVIDIASDAIITLVTSACHRALLASELVASAWRDAHINDVFEHLSRLCFPGPTDRRKHPTELTAEGKNAVHLPPTRVFATGSNVSTPLVAPQGSVKTVTEPLADGTKTRPSAISTSPTGAPTLALHNGVHTFGTPEQPLMPRESKALTVPSSAPM